MKKLLLATLAFACSLGAYAVQLSPDEALARARQDAPAGRTATSSSAMKLVKTGQYNNRNNYYVFSDGRSSMILSAEDIAVPVLGYLDRPVDASTPMPPQLVWWLDGVGRQIDHALANPSGKASNPVVSLRKQTERRIRNAAGALRTATKSNISPLLSTEWDQMAPYNNYCPSTSVPTGCVATAVSQVMKYHAYPEKGTGTVSVTYNSTTYSETIDNYTLNWSLMLNTYASSTSGTSAQRDAVARLMQLVGYSVNMSYATSGSGAYDTDIAPALINNFKYDVGAHVDCRDYYAPADWEDLVYAELSASRPLIYGGSGTDGGHEFVCDGYQSSTDKYHFNWGWSGNYDGYFAMTSLVPSGQGTGGNSDGFTSGQSAIFGVQAPVSGSTAAPAWLAPYNATLSGSYSGSTVTITATKVDSSYSAYLFWNGSDADFSGKLGYAIVTESGDATNYTKYSNQSLPTATALVSSMSVTMPSTLADGTYYIRLMYCIGSTWSPLRIPYGDPNAIKVVISSGSISEVSNVIVDLSGGNVETEASIEYSDTTSTTGYYIGRDFDFKVKLTNSGTKSATKSLHAALFKQETDGYYYKSTYTDQSVTIAGQSNVDVTFTGTINSGIDDGTYLMGIVDDGYIVAGWDVNVVKKPAHLTYSTAYTTTTNFVVGSAYDFTITITNDGDVDATKEFKAYAMADDLETVLSVGTVQSVTVPANGSVTPTFTGTMNADAATGDEQVMVLNDGTNDVEMWIIPVTAASTDPDPDPEPDPEPCTVTFDFTDATKLSALTTNTTLAASNSTENGATNILSNVSFTNGVVTLGFAKGNGSNHPRWWKNTDNTLEFRAYASNVITISLSSDEYYISQIEFVKGKSSDWNVTAKSSTGMAYSYETVASTEGTWSNRTWTAPTDKAVSTFTLTPTGKAFAGTVNVSLGTFTGVNRIEEEAQPAEYYNLQGIRVQNPARGIYIEKRGNRTRKVLK